MKKSGILQIFFGLALSLTISSQVRTAGFDQSHTLYNDLLKTYVNDAKVNYAALKAHPQELERYLDQVSSVSKAEFNQWTINQQISFLINTYNAYTLKLIIDNYPIKSIKDIGHFWSGPWDQPIVYLFVKTITLNTIEQEILRKNYNEPRIHFALVCASVGCPPLRNEPYIGNSLDEQLNDQARRFLSNRSKNHVDIADHTVYLSPIFKWYSEDFIKKRGSVLAFLQPYWPEEEQKVLNSGGFEIRYTEYDWSLNEAQK